jgi:hypothetical protein
MEALPVLSNDSRVMIFSFFCPNRFQWVVFHAWHGFRQMALVLPIQWDRGRLMMVVDLASAPRCAQIWGFGDSVVRWFDAFRRSFRWSRWVKNMWLLVWRTQMKHLHKNNHQSRIRESYHHDRASVTTSQQDSEESIGVNFHRSELPSECTPSTGCNFCRELCVGVEACTMHILKQSTLQCNVAPSKNVYLKSRNEDVCVGCLPWKVS